jgi:undecaprenyl-diphosphatase
MDTLTAIIYGLIQGLTEFLPVSSDGHLKLAHAAKLSELPKSISDPFDILLHAASLMAIFIAFRREFAQILLPFWRCVVSVTNLRAFRHNVGFVWQQRHGYIFLVLCMLPAGVTGLFLGSRLEVWGKMMWVISLGFLVNFILLQLAHWKLKHMTASGPLQSQELNALPWYKGLFIGFFQASAILSSISRSGSTISGGILGGLRGELAIAVSFLTGAPLILAATGKDALDGGFSALYQFVGLLPLTIAFVTTFMVSIFAISLLRSFVVGRHLHWFGWYCLVLSIICFIMYLRGY